MIVSIRAANDGPKDDVPPTIPFVEYVPSMLDCVCDFDCLRC